MPEIIELPATKNPGQKSLTIADSYLARFVPAWSKPPGIVDGNAWRNVVNAQPVAITCKENLISSLLSLDWKVSVRDSSLQDELAGTVKYYTRLFEKAGYGSDLDYTSHVEWVAGDILDTPFGGGSELGRKDGSLNGRVVWVEPLDAATLYPTLNQQYPVLQSYNGNMVAFQKELFARAYFSPRSRIEYKGWGMAPPEKIFIALQMLARGDIYYANLLLDIPTTGILDLGDMEKESALEWVNAYKDLLANGGNSSFKIPVLYEHQNEIRFVPFGKVPNDIMFDRIILQYAALVCAGYGMTLSDIGIQVTASGGETLAGSIRSERKTRKTGFARLKKKMKFYWDTILPPVLQFNWVDYDDEVNVALGRARLSNATAFKMLQEAGDISEDEARQQLIADGMFTISMGEKAPGIKKLSQPKQTPNRPGMLGNPVPVSTGGQGEIRKSFVEPINIEIARLIVAHNLETVHQPLLDLRNEYGEDGLFEAKSAVQQDVIEHLHRVNCDFVASKIDIPQNVIEKAEETVDKYVILMLSEYYLSDDGVDFSDPVVYDSVLKTVSTKLVEDYVDLVDTSINNLYKE